MWSGWEALMAISPRSDDARLPMGQKVSPPSRLTRSWPPEDAKMTCGSRGWKAGRQLVSLRNCRWLIIRQ